MAVQARRGPLPASITYAAPEGPQGPFLLLPARALWGRWALPLPDLRILARILDAGALSPVGATLSIPQAAAAWGLSYDRLAASVRKLAAWGYLSRERAGRCQRFYALDWPRELVDPGPIPAWERAMRPLVPLRKGA